MKLNKELLLSNAKKARHYSHVLPSIGLQDNQIEALKEFLVTLCIDVIYRSEWIDDGDAGFIMKPVDIVIDWSSPIMLSNLKLAK